MNLNRFKSQDKFLMLALDQRGSFRRMLSPENPESLNPQKGIRVKGEILASCYDQYSGTLIDFEYGLPAYKLVGGFTKPFLLPAEKTGYVKEGESRITEIEKNAEDIKNAGASGVKLLIYFNKDDPMKEKQFETCKKVIADAHNNDLPLFLEIVHYDVEIQDRNVAESVQIFLDNDIIPDVFKLEYPGSLEQSQKVSDLLDKTPWIVLTAGVDFDEFVPQLTNAIKGGCSGFLAGRALWKEYLSLDKYEEKEEFLLKTLPERFKKVSQITLSN